METKYENKAAAPAPKMTRIDLFIRGMPVGYYTNKRGHGVTDQLRQFCELQFGLGTLVKHGRTSYTWIHGHGSDQQAVPDEAADGGTG